jgi:CO/xanthine dehydrogenase Mo-binding subunit
VTFATGIAVINATREVIRDCKARAAKIWEVEPDAVVWEDGAAKPASTNVGDLRAAVARQDRRDGGQDRRSDQRPCAAQRAGRGRRLRRSHRRRRRRPGHGAGGDRSLHHGAGRRHRDPSEYVEGQMQGGAAQGIGWALNEEYIYDAKGKLDNPGFLDYRMPVASDLPMIETVIVEVPNPHHPYGVRGVGEVPIVPPMAAIGSAIARNTGVRMTALPMSPPRLSAALDAAAPRVAAE